MTLFARRLGFAGIIAVAVAAGCRSSERQAAEAARNTADAAVTPQQEQLWRDAADRGDTPGLERVPAPQEPVRDRERPVVQSKPVPSQTVTIPKDVISQLRILTHPADSTNYKGPATVAAVVGETITLNLGKAGMLTVLARAGGKSLPLAKDDVVDVFYQERVDPDVPDDVIAIRTKSGAGIANVVRVGSAPLKFSVPLFDINLVQDDKPGLTALPVLITAPSFKDAATFSTGEIKSVGDAMALVVGSTSSPFTVNVLVWRNP